MPQCYVIYRIKYLETHNAFGLITVSYEIVSFNINTNEKSIMINHYLKIVLELYIVML